MKNLTKAMVGTVAAGAMAVSTASPAMARDHKGGVDAGDVIAGALIIGGIAAVAAAASKKDKYRYRDGYGYRDGRDYRYHRAGYGRGYGARDDVGRCVRAAERNASRYGYGNADVTHITSVRNKRDGYDVKGRIVVEDRYRGYRRGGYDEGKFTCKVRYGRISDIDYSGIRGLR